MTVPKNESVDWVRFRRAQWPQYQSKSRKESFTTLSSCARIMTVRTKAGTSLAKDWLSSSTQSSSEYPALVLMTILHLFQYIQNFPLHQKSTSKVTQSKTLPTITELKSSLWMRIKVFISRIKQEQPPPTQPYYIKSCQISSFNLERII